MEKNNPLVSIIVRTKDRPKLLNGALQSIVSQTYRPIEVVLVNDGGCEPDIEGTKGILGTISLNYVRFEKNRGRAAAGNAGIGNAAGDYIGFLDDDDEFLPDHVSTAVNLLQGSDYKVVYSDSLMVHKEYSAQMSELVEVGRNLVFSYDFDYDFLVFENYIPLMCLLFDRKALLGSGGFDETMSIYEDWDLLVRIGEETPFFHIKKTTAHYAQWDADLQISQRNKDHRFVEESYQKVLLKHKDKINEKRVRSYISKFVRERQLLKEATAKAAFWEKAFEELKERYASDAPRKTDIEPVVSEMETQISILRTDADADRSHIAKIEADLKDKEMALSNIYNSNGRQALLKYYRVREMIFPPNSKRNFFIKLLLIAFRNPRGLLKSLTIDNIKKVYQYRAIDPSILESKIKRKTSSGWDLGRAYNGTGAAVTVDRSGSFFAGDNISLLQETGAPGQSGQGKRVLVIDWMVPTYDMDSGSLRMYSILGILTGLGYKVTFLPDDMQKKEPYTSELQKMGIEVLYGNLDIEKYLKESGHLFNFVMLSRAEQAVKYMSLVRAYAPYSSVIYDTVDLHWVRFEREAEVKGKDVLRTKAANWKSMELLSASCADVILTVTEEEKAILLKENPSLVIDVIPNVHEIHEDDVPFHARRDLMFIGGYTHEPNQDAVLYFVKEIFPIIRKKCPDMKFIVVGSSPPSAILNLRSADIEVTGYVKDIKPYFEKTRVFVSPLRYGAGMKGKIGQSMSFGLPVVTTLVGAEGLDLREGMNAMIVDEGPAAFAEAVIRLYTDEALWNNISAASRSHIEKNYSRKVVSRKIELLFGGIKEVKGVCCR